MSILRAFITPAFASALILGSLLTTSAFAQSTATTPDGTASAVPEAAALPVQAAPTPPPQTIEDRYKDGMVIWQAPAGAATPFLLKFNINTQLRYLNTLSSDDTFTDHLGVVREVHRRNDITVNRAMFIFGDYVFDEKLRYSFTVWTSAGAASIVVAGGRWLGIQWRLHRHGRIYGVPGSRSVVDTFPFFQAIDRSMADNVFRPASHRSSGRRENLSRD